MPTPSSGEDKAAPSRESRWARTTPLLLLLLVALLMANGMWGATVGLYVRTPDPVIGRPNYDFFIFYVAGHDWRVGLDPYASLPWAGGTLDFPVGSGGEVDGYIYPPTMLPVYGLLSRLPYDTARLLWLAINVVTFAAVIGVAAALNRKRWLEIVVACVLLTMGSYAFLSVIHQGQIDLLVSSVTVLAFLLYGRRGDWPTAILLALATLTKVMPAVVLLAMVAYYRDLALLGKTLLCVAVATLLSLLFVDPGAYQQYVVSVLPAASVPDPMFNNLSALRFLSGAPGVARVATTLGWVFLTFISYIAGARSRARSPQSRRVSRQTEHYALLVLSIVFALYFSPLLWSMTMVWLTLPLALLLTSPPPRGRPWAPVAVGVGVVLSLAVPGVGPLAGLHGVAAIGLAITAAAVIFFYLPFGSARGPELA